MSIIRRRKRVEMEQVSDEPNVFEDDCPGCAQDPRVNLYHFNWYLYRLCFHDCKIDHCHGARNFFSYGVGIQCTEIELLILSRSIVVTADVDFFDASQQKVVR